MTQFGFDLPSQLEFSFTDVTMIQDILVSDDGDYYVALNEAAILSMQGWFHLQSAGSSENCFVLKFNESGAFKWSIELHSQQRVAMRMAHVQASQNMTMKSVSSILEQEVDLVQLEANGS